MRNLVLSASTNMVTTGLIDNAVAAPENRVTGGRPLGTTYTKKKNCELAIIVVKNEISERYDAYKKKTDKNDWPLGTLLELFLK